MKDEQKAKGGYARAEKLSPERRQEIARNAAQKRWSAEPKHKGEIWIDGKKYSCEVINGERFIDGKTVNEFMRALPVETLVRLAKVGKKALQDEKQGNLDTDYQGDLSQMEFLER